MSTETTIDPRGVPRIARGYRLQYENAQAAWVLLYPEGLVKLSETAAEIVQRVDGSRSVDALIAELEGAYPGVDLRGDVIEFLENARGRGWITIGR